MTDIALSLMVLTTLALIGGAVWLWRRKRAGRRALLMLVLAAVIAVNVALWVVPDESGQSLATAASDR